MNDIGDKTLEQLENDYWPPLTSNEGSYLLNTCHELRSKKINSFEIEDLRIMIGQSIGLKYLVPYAIEELKGNILAEGHFYEGDLLKAILSSDFEYWKNERENWKSICDLFESNIAVLESETHKPIRKGWFEAFEKFKAITA